MSLCHGLRVGGPRKPATERAEHQWACTHCPLPRGVVSLWSAASRSCCGGFSAMTGCILDPRARINPVCLQQILSGCLIKAAGKATRTSTSPRSPFPSIHSQETSWPHSFSDFENEHPSSPGRAEHGWGPPKTQPRELLLIDLSVNSLKISTYRACLSNKN